MHGKVLHRRPYAINQRGASKKTLVGGFGRDELLDLEVDQPVGLTRRAEFKGRNVLVEVCYHEGGAGSDLSAMIVQEYSLSILLETMIGIFPDFC